MTISLYDVYEYVSEYVLERVPKYLLSVDDCVEYFKKCLAKGIDSDRMLFEDGSISEYIDEVYYDGIDAFIGKHNDEDIIKMACDHLDMTQDELYEYIENDGQYYSYIKHNYGYYDIDVFIVLIYLLGEEFGAGNAMSLIYSDLGFVIEDALTTNNT